MTMGSQTGFPTGDPVSAFSALNLLRNYNQFLGPPGANNLMQVYHYSCGSALGDIPEDPSRPESISLSSIGAFQPYLHYSLPPSSSLAELKSRQAFIPAASVYGRRPRGEKKPIPDDQKDDRYYERRKRNNQAAKKSRDARKLREDQIALRAALLEHENAILRAQLLTLREETQSLRQLILTQKKVPALSVYTKKDCGIEGVCINKWENDFDLSIKDLNNSVE